MRHSGIWLLLALVLAAPLATACNSSTSSAPSSKPTGHVVGSSTTHVTPVAADAFREGRAPSPSAVSSEADGRSATSAPASVPAPQLVVAPTEVKLVDAGDGWQDLSVELGVRNDGTAPGTFTLPADQSVGQVTIQEGPSYDVTLKTEGYRTYDEQVGLHAVVLPPGFALCGRPRAEGRVPQGTVPMTLNLGDHAPVDLTRKPPRDFCAPATAGLPSVRSFNSAGADTAAMSVRLRFSLADSMQELSATPEGFREGGLETDKVVRLELTNLNRFGDLSVDDLWIWEVTDHGDWVVPVGFERPPYSYYAIESACVLTDPTSLTLGPSQTGTVNACFPHVSSVAAIVVSSPTTTISAAVATDNSVASPGPGSTPAAIPTQYVGAWVANLAPGMAPEVRGVSVALTSGSVGGVVGSTHYPALSCDGALVLQRVDAGSITLSERIIGGSGRCASGAQISLSFSEAGDLQLEKTAADGGSDVAVTLVRKDGDQSRPATPTR